MDSGRVRTGVIVAIAVVSLAGCGSPPAQSATAAPPTAAPTSPPVSPLEHLADTTLHSFGFSANGATTACTTSPRTCQTYELAGDAAIAAFFTQEKQTPVSPAVAAVDQGLHHDLVQWMTLGDVLVASIGQPQQLQNAYALDHADVQIQVDLHDLVNAG